MSRKGKIICVYIGVVASICAVILTISFAPAYIAREVGMAAVALAISFLVVIFFSGCVFLGLWIVFELVFPCCATPYDE